MKHSSNLIREATLDDIPALLGMGERFFNATPYHALTTFDRAAMAGVYARMIEAEEAAILVPHDATGFIGLIISDLYFAPQTKICNELFWWIDPARRGSGLKLLDVAEAWAVQHGANIIAFSAVIDLNGDRIARLYERRNMVRAETTYMKEIG